MDAAIARAATEEILNAVLPKGKKRKGARGDEEGEQNGANEPPLRTEQVTVLGQPEIQYLRSIAQRIAGGAHNEKAVRENAKHLEKGELAKNIQALVRGAGIDAALFGRMTTGDMLSRCDAAIHVAHAFTVHDGQFETDYFSALDDLQSKEETGSGHINTSELSSGLFYGYVVVDVPSLVSNLEGCKPEDWQSADRSLASEVIRRFVHLIATVSPGAKLGSTAPYAYASMVLAESGSRQPRTLANAFLRPVPLRRPSGGGADGYDVLLGAYVALAEYLVEHDRMYGVHEERRIAAQNPPEQFLAASIARLDLVGLSAWAADCVRGQK
jgi:CRISPR system Cascade subunit CasC